MSENKETVYEKMVARYESGDLPWQHELPPPEVMEAAERLPPGRFLDLGCGLGRASIYMAQKGWQVDGIDFVDRAIEQARERAATADLAINYYCGNILDLGYLDPFYDLVLDVGCGHSLDVAGWKKYHRNLSWFIRPGGEFLLYGRLRTTDEMEWGLEHQSFMDLMADGFELTKWVPGETELPTGEQYDSAWYWFRRSDSN